MSKIRQNLEYYRLGSVIETEIGIDNESTVYSNTYSTSGQIKNVVAGTDQTDAVNVSQLPGIYMFPDTARTVLADTNNVYTNDSNTDIVNGSVNLLASGVPSDADGVICNVYLKMNRPVTGTGILGYGASFYINNMDAELIHIEQNMSFGDTQAVVHAFIPSISTTEPWRFSGTSNLASTETGLPKWSVKVNVIGYYINGQ